MEICGRKLGQLAINLPVFSPANVFRYVVLVGGVNFLVSYITNYSFHGLIGNHGPSLLKVVMPYKNYNYCLVTQN